MSNFKKIAMKGTLTVVTLLISLIVIIACIRHYETSVMEDRVGESVVVNKDTLVIISFSTFTDEYMLSNGTSISDEYLNNLTPTK